MNDKDNLIRAFDMLREALFSNDVDKLDQLMADDYVGYDPLGNPQDKALSLKAYQPGAATLDRYDADDVTTRIIGDGGVITGKGHIQGSYDGGEFEHDLRFLDMYIIRDGRWQLYLSQVTPLAAEKNISA